jgi:hypothetical protein
MILSICARAAANNSEQKMFSGQTQAKPSSQEPSPNRNSHKNRRKNFAKLTFY